MKGKERKNAENNEYSCHSWVPAVFSWYKTQGSRHVPALCPGLSALWLSWWENQRALTFPQVAFWIFWPLWGWIGAAEGGVEHCPCCARGGQPLWAGIQALGHVERGIASPEQDLTRPWSPHTHLKCFGQEILPVSHSGVPERAKCTQFKKRKASERHSCSVNSFQKRMCDPAVSLWVTSVHLVKIRGGHKGDNVMCALMHNCCSFFMRKFLPFLLVIYFSAGSLSTQLRALQWSSGGEKYLQVIRISFFELRVPIFLQHRRKRRFWIGG